MSGGFIYSHPHQLSPGKQEMMILSGKRNLDNRQETTKGSTPSAKKTSMGLSFWAENNCSQKPREMRFKQMATQKDIVRNNFLVYEVNGALFSLISPHETNNSQRARHKTLISSLLRGSGLKEMRWRQEVPPRQRLSYMAWL